MKGLATILALLIAGAPPALTCAGATAVPASPEDSADQAVYAARFAAFQKGRVYDYAPMEAAPGVAHPQPLPLAAKSDIAPEALAAARAYAAANNSSALLIWRDGALAAADYFGGADADKPLVSKSLSKPLTAIVIGRAIKLGFIKSVDEPVSDFITEWKGGPKAGMTIRHLLDMRSGLLPQAFPLEADSVLNRAYLDPHHGAILINEYPLLHEPGTRFDYANAVGDLVAIFIERATHQRYAQFLSEQVFKPIGAQGGSIWIDRPEGLAHSACCMLAPAETWLRLGVLLMDDGVWKGRRLLPAGYVADMRRGTPQNPYYGMGLYVSTPYVQRRGFNNPDQPGPRVLQGEPYQAKDLFLLDGNHDQVVDIVPSERLVILRMGEAPPKSPEWDNAVLPNLILRGIAKRAPGWAPQPRP
jgi:CubicO group peptidase (beta-lactamase class C family)